MSDGKLRTAREGVEACIALMDAERRKNATTMRQIVHWNLLIERCAAPLFVRCIDPPADDAMARKFVEGLKNHPPGTTLAYVLPPVKGEPMKMTLEDEE